MRVVTNERLRYPQNPWVWTFLTKEGETRKVIWRLYYKGVHCEKTSDDRNQHTVTYTRRGAEDLIETGTVKRRYSVENDVVTCVELDPVNDTVIETVHHDVDFYIGDIDDFQPGEDFVLGVGQDPEILRIRQMFKDLWAKKEPPILSRATAVPSSSSRATAAPSSSARATAAPSSSARATAAPSSSARATAAPSSSARASAVPSPSSRATAAPSPSSKATEAPSSSSSRTQVPLVSSIATPPAFSLSSSQAIAMDSDDEVCDVEAASSEDIDIDPPTSTCSTPRQVQEEEDANIDIDPQENAVDAGNDDSSNRKILKATKRRSKIRGEVQFSDLDPENYIDWTFAPQSIKQIGVCDEPDKYEVEAVLDRRLRSNGHEYLVKWIGWSSEFNSWEPESNFVTKTMIHRYLEAYGLEIP
ncbi:uncharacterized protein LOC110853089 [Folsomia candida]|uniref:Chromobox protein 8 n=1 Tax=Folsomia candida TaxID=158441 RepID=A0A226DZP4_FOLCA|nr:uncharacterized protein LOC110853089 [Folsomia candida]XP_035710264.1 uncharacterized protein LOC110853089 [Folsomia candida]XP_035710265.1 uncharacterized protein LOC110853089 [Folsomia candida]OXA50942.1 Chromobox protein 8 [Folsomia candida]